MMYHGTQKQEIAQADGVRHVEFRYSGEIDSAGKIRLKRCVGKSFLDKSGNSNVALGGAVKPACLFSGACQKKTA